MDFVYYEEYLKVYQTKYCYGSVRKANFHLAGICRLIKNQLCKKYEGEGCQVAH